MKYEQDLSNNMVVAFTSMFTFAADLLSLLWKLTRLERASTPVDQSCHTSHVFGRTDKAFHASTQQSHKSALESERDAVNKQPRNFDDGQIKDVN